MIIEANKLLNFPVLSVHTGGMIGRVKDFILDPETLKIIGFKIMGHSLGNGENGDILLPKYIREYSSKGLIIDSVDDLASYGDVVAVDKVLDLKFNIIGLLTVTKKGTKLGRVINFSVDSETLTLIQFTVKRPLLKSFLDSELLISRKEIVEVDDYKITVKDEEDKIKSKNTKEDFVPNFVNPFREANLSPNHKESPALRDRQ